MAEEKSAPIPPPTQGGMHTIVDGKVVPTAEELEARKEQAAALEKDPHQDATRRPPEE